jgi:hypothetical protein
MQNDPVIDESRAALWFRLLWMFLFFLVIFYAVSVIVAVTGLAQFILILINGAPNGRLREFSASMNRYAHHVLRYITFNDALKPFPFSPFPESD